MFWATLGGKRVSHTEAPTEVPWLPLVLSLVSWEQGQTPPWIVFGAHTKDQTHPLSPIFLPTGISPGTEH